MRKWFEKNKIFFEVGQNTLLGIMAVSISIASYKIDAAEFDLHQIQAAPAIRIVPIQILNDSTGYFDDFTLEIYNDGERLSEFKCSTQSFLKVNGTCARCREHSISFIPIQYFNTFFNTNNSKDKITTVFGKANNLIITKLANELNETSRISNSTFYFQVVSILTISYKDVRNIEHTEYFLANEINIRRIDKTKADSVSDLVSTTIKDREIRLDQLTPDTIRSLYYEHNEPASKISALIGN